MEKIFAVVKIENESIKIKKIRDNSKYHHTVKNKKISELYRDTIEKYTFYIHNSYNVNIYRIKLNSSREKNEIKLYDSIIKEIKPYFNIDQKQIDIDGFDPVFREIIKFFKKYH